MKMTISEFAKKIYRSEDLKARSGRTYCNFFVRRVAVHVECWEFDGMMANQMVEHMARSDKWALLEPDMAQAEANKGALVVAGWRNPIGNGHVCIVVKGKLTWSKSHEDDVPLCCNVATKPLTFYGRPISYAFSAKKKPTYWVWRPSQGGQHGT